jgi:hypothetical protein
LKALPDQVDNCKSFKWASGMPVPGLCRAVFIASQNSRERARGRKQTRDFGNEAGTGQAAQLQTAWKYFGKLSAAAGAPRQR